MARNERYYDYIPNKFCREFVELKKSAVQITNYMGVVAGLKPLLDDWIPVQAMDAFAGACRKYGILYKSEAVWMKEASDEELRNVAGGDGLNTTKFYGSRYDSGISQGNVHVFVARSEEALDKGYRSGWYPLIIGSTAIYKPFIDYFRFGAALGYPECCINYFMKENPKRNFLYSILKNSKGKLNYLCNCLNKDNIYSYIFHMPCSFNCEKTIQYCEALRGEIKKHEPRFAGQIDFHLKAPFLVFEEQNAYSFDGEVIDIGTISYKKAFFIGNSRNNIYGDRINAADKLQIQNDVIRLFRSNILVCEIAKNRASEGFLLYFDS
jgi:hypothetical protein